MVRKLVRARIAGESDLCLSVVFFECESSIQCVLHPSCLLSCCETWTVTHGFRVWSIFNIFCLNAPFFYNQLIKNGCSFDSHNFISFSMSQSFHCFSLVKKWFLGCCLSTRIMGSGKWTRKVSGSLFIRNSSFTIVPHSSWFTVQTPCGRRYGTAYPYLGHWANG